MTDIRLFATQNGVAVLELNFILLDLLYNLNIQRICDVPPF
jgi:hypothetical protein